VAPGRPGQTGHFGVPVQRRRRPVRRDLGQWSEASTRVYGPS